MDNLSESVANCESVPCKKQLRSIVTQKIQKRLTEAIHLIPIQNVTNDNPNHGHNPHAVNAAQIVFL